MGEEIGLEKGDAVTHFDGKPVADVLDYEYYEGQEDFSLTVLTKDGQTVTVDVEKDCDETLGLTFEDGCYLTPRACRNKCVFCFVDQMPRGMRKTLYFKDDDWRLSFAAGNYVTFTNLTEEEIKRILEKKFSPLYVSVHATDDVLRRRMLGNPSAAAIMPLMRRFAEGGITMHAQIVLCPGLNDGDALRKSLEDLYSLWPSVRTVSVVPVGLTRFRDNLPAVKAVDAVKAAEILRLTDEFAEKCVRETGARFAWCSDEFYVLSGEQPLPYEEYGDFAQIENGVGLLAKFQREFDESLPYFTGAKKQSFTIATGESAYKFINGLVDRLKEKFGVRCDVRAVPNDFYGTSVTVTGLLTAGDILKNLDYGKNCGDVLLISRSMLKETEDVFLDGMTLERFRAELGKKVEVTENDGFDFCARMLKGEE